MLRSSPWPLPRPCSSSSTITRDQWVRQKQRPGRELGRPWRAATDCSGWVRDWARRSPNWRSWLASRGRSCSTSSPLTPSSSPPVPSCSFPRSTARVEARPATLREAGEEDP